MRTSCVEHPSNEPLIIIRQWQLEFTEGNHCAAALLSFFEYWHNIRMETSQKAAHVQAQAEKHGDEESLHPAIGTNLQWHTEAELKAGILALYGESTISKALKILERKGAISVHKNPHPRYVFDKTRHFLFHPDAVNSWLSSRKNTSRRGKSTSRRGKNTSAIPETSSEITPEKHTQNARACEEDFSETEDKQPGNYGEEHENVEDGDGYYHCPACNESWVNGSKPRHVPGCMYTPDLDTLQPVATPSAASGEAVPPAEACRAYQGGIGIQCEHEREALMIIRSVLWPGWPETGPRRPGKPHPLLHAFVHESLETYREDVRTVAELWKATREPKDWTIPLMLSNAVELLANAQSQDDPSARRLTIEEERAREKTRRMVARMQAEDEAYEREKVLKQQRKEAARVQRLQGKA